MHWHLMHKDKATTPAAGSSAASSTTASINKVEAGDDSELPSPLVSLTTKQTGLSLTPTSTQSSHASASSSSSSSASVSRTSTFASIVAGHSKHPHDTHSQHHARPIKLEGFSSPQELVESAISVIFSIPGPSLEMLRSDILPKLYHPAYSHRVNARELTLEQVIDTVIWFRARYSSVRVRFTKALTDMDGSATLQGAAVVGLNYEIIALPIGRSKDVEEKRTTAIAVVKTCESRLAQSDSAVDTQPFKMPEPQVECSIM